MNVTRHAAERWAERVTGNRGEPNSIRDAVAAIESHSTAVKAAAKFGAKAVKLANKHRLVLQGDTVVTVLPEGRFAG